MKNIRKIFGFLVFFVLVVGQMLNAFAGGNCTLYGMANYADFEDDITPYFGCYVCPNNDYNSVYGTCESLYNSASLVFYTDPEDISGSRKIESIKDHCKDDTIYDYFLGRCVTVDDCKDIYGTICTHPNMDNYCYLSNGAVKAFDLESVKDNASWCPASGAVDIQNCVCMDDEAGNGVQSYCLQVDNEFVTITGEKVSWQECLLTYHGVPDSNLCTCYPVVSACALCDGDVYNPNTHSCISATDCRSNTAVNVHGEVDSTNCFCIPHARDIPVEVTLDYNDGTGTTDSVRAILDSDMVHLENIPTRNGYVFKGFFDAVSGGNKYYDENGESAHVWSDTVTDNKLYARWTPNCNKITLNANGGNVGSTSVLYKKTDETTTFYTNSSCTTVYSAPISIVPSRTGYTFRGFYTSAISDVSSTGTSGTSYIMHTGGISTTGQNWTISSATTLYAGWAKNCTQPTNGTCSLSISGNTVTYTTTCDTGYTISGNGTASPTCTANTNSITFNKNANDAVNANQVSGYTLVDYVQSSGTGDNTTTGQYIDSGYKPGPNTKVLVDYQLTNASNTGALFGNYSDTGGGASFAFYVTDNYAYAGSTTKITSGVSRDTARHTVTLDAKSKQFKYGNTVKTISTVSQCSNNMPIFARYYNGEIKYRVSAKIYNFKIYEGEVLVRNFMPAKENSTDTYGLYDMVSDSFFPPTGGNLTGGNESDFVQSVVYGTALPSVTPPTRTGYTFSGYYDAQTGGNQYYNSNGISTQTWTNTSDVTLYAHWTPNTITLLWNDGGHGTAPTSPASCVYGSTFTMPSALTATGYTFQNWSVNGETFSAGQPSVACDSATLGVTSGTATITANWGGGCFEITLNKNGGDSLGDIQSLYKKPGEKNNFYTDANCSEVYTTVEKIIPTRFGYTFRGFYAGANSFDKQYISNSGEITSDGAQWSTISAAILYAGWAQNCSTVTNGTCSLSINGNTVTYTTTCDTGYTISGNGTASPTCTANTYTVTLDKNGGTGSCGGATDTTSGTVTCSAGESCALPQYSNCSISQTKKVFVGWSTSSSATTGSFSITPTGNATYYAVWVTPTCTAGTDVASTSLDSVSSNKPVCSVTCNSGYYHAATQTGSAGATTLTTSCSACSNKPTNSSYSGPATTNACPWICNSGYFGKSESGATSCTICPNGSYCASGVQNSCPTPETNWTYASGTGWSSYSSCKEEKTGESISSYCSAGVLQKTASSATAWGTTATITTALSAKAGSYVNDQTCTQCTGATYSGGGEVTSCTSCPTSYTADTTAGKTSASACKISVSAGKYIKTANSATQTACANGKYNTSHTVSYGSTSSCSSCPAVESGWTYTSGTGWTAVTSCKEEKSGTSISQYCSAGKLQKTATNATTWGESTIATALTANAGSYVNDQTCSQCTGATYSGGGEVTSCTSCPTATSGWTRGTGTGWTNYSSCYQTRNATSVSTYCSAGKLKKVATSASAWGTTTIQTPLQAVEGAVVNGQNCIACPIGSTSSGGSATQCSPCSAGYTTTSIGATTCTACPDSDKVSSWENTTIDSTNVVSGLCKATSCKATFAFAETNSHEILNVATVNKGTQNAYINSNTNKVTSHSKNSIITIQTEIGKRYFIKKTVGSPYSGSSVIIGFSSSIPTTSTTFSNRSFGQSTSNNELTFVANDVYSTFLIRGDVDGANTSLTVTSIVNGLQISVDNLTTNTCSMCDSGYYCSGGTSAAIICPNGSYCSEGIENNCSSLSGVSVTGGTYTTSPTSGATANTACRYTAPTKTSTGCETVITNTVSYSGSSWPATTYSVTANAGYFIANNNTATAKCTQCTGATYSGGGTATSCTACPANYTASTTDGKTQIGDCKISVSGGNYIKTANDTTVTQCGAGTYKATHTVAYGSTSSCSNCSGRTKYSAAGASSCSSVTSGYYATGCNSSGNKCTGQSQCSNGTYCASGVQNNCPTGYSNSVNGATAQSQCYTTCSEGYVVASANAVCSVPSSGYQTGSHNVYYGSTTPTASDTTTPTAGTWYSCLTNYSATGTVATSHDARDDCKISCSAGTKIASANATSCTTPTGNWYTSAHTVSAGSISGTNCSSGYSISGTTASDHDAQTDCKITCSAGQYVATNKGGCVNVGAGYYRAGSETVAETSVGTRNACSALGGGLFTLTKTETSTKTSDCYLKTTSGKYISNSNNNALTTCTAGYYCPGNIEVVYGAAPGGITACPTNYSSSASGTTTINDCYLTLTKGLYVASVGGGTSSCPANKYSDNTSKVYYGGTASSTHATTSTCSNCSSLGGGLYATSVAGSGSDGCYLTTTAGYYITSTDDTAQTVCPKSYYCPVATLYYPNTGNKNACPGETTHKMTTYPSDWYDVLSVSVAMSTSTKRTALTSCSIVYTTTNERGEFKITKTYNTTTNKYDTGGSKYYTVINPGYYGQTKYYADTTCNSNSSNTYKMYYEDVGICPAGYYCPGYTPIPNCNSGTYNTEMGKIACVKGSYSTGGTSVCTECSNGFTTNGAGQSTCTACPVIAHWASWLDAHWNDDNTMSPATCRLASCESGYTVGSDAGGDICNPNTITINWDENGGSTSPSELVEIDDGSCEYGGSLLMPSVELYRTGYVFNGWSL